MINFPKGVIDMINELTGWSQMKSLKLSRLLALALMILLFTVLGLAYFIAVWYDTISVGEGIIKSSVVLPLTVGIYICDVFGIIAVFSLNKLLSNIAKDMVFTEENTKCLRLISWCCVFAGLVMLILALWRYVLGVGAFFAMFMGLVMRVLKNVFEKAVEIKSENDYTI